MGLNRSPLQGASGGGAPDPAPTLKEYLQFGRMIGERVQDVQRQLDMNSTPVQVDEDSARYMEEWQNQQMSAYAMFETMVGAALDGPAQAQGNSTLERNKNRVSAIHHHLNSLGTFHAGRLCLTTPLCPLLLYGRPSRVSAGLESSLNRPTALCLAPPLQHSAS